MSAALERAHLGPRGYAGIVLGRRGYANFVNYRAKTQARLLEAQQAAEIMYQTARANFLAAGRSAAERLRPMLQTTYRIAESHLQRAGAHYNAIPASLSGGVRIALDASRDYLRNPIQRLGTFKVQQGTQPGSIHTLYFRTEAVAPISYAEYGRRLSAATASEGRAFERAQTQRTLRRADLSAFRVLY